jgi:hypothetical protein
MCIVRPLRRALGIFAASSNFSRDRLSQTTVWVGICN